MNCSGTSSLVVYVYSLNNDSLLLASAINPQSPWEVYASNIKKIRPVEVPFFASKLSSVRQKTISFQRHFKWLSDTS